MRIYLVCAAMLLLSGCSRCSEVPKPMDPAPVDGPAESNEEISPEETSDMESYPGEHEHDAETAEEDAILERRLEQENESRRQELLKQHGVKMDRPGPAKPNEDRD